MKKEYLIYKLSEDLKEATRIENELFRKFDVKRGLRNEDGTGVLVGLTKIGNVVGYERIPGGGLKPIPGKLFYRGYDVDDLAHAIIKEKRFGFEEIAYLLLSGRLPDKEELSSFRELINDNMPLEQKTKMNIIELEGNNIMNILARSVLEMYRFDPDADDTSRDNLMRQSIELISKFPTIIAYAYNMLRHATHGRSLHIRHPQENLSIAENFLYMLKKDYTELDARTLDLLLVLQAEHGGGNNSTFTVRVTSSTGTDTYSSIAAGIGSLKGPLHGGANIQVADMFHHLQENIQDWTNVDEIDTYFTRMLNKEAYNKTGLIYGIGHAVYTISDPRAILLKELARDLAREKGKEREFAFLELLEERAIDVFGRVKNNGKTVSSNVDFYSGFVYEMIGLPQEIFTPLFAMARIVGWCAHRNEELNFEGKRIIRPAYKNVLDEVTYIFVLYVATTKVQYLGAGLAGGTLASIVAYHLFSHVKTRVQAWRDPWAEIRGGGYQVAQSLFAIGTGGFIGMGLGKGLPGSVPVVESDFVFSAISEELGGVFAICLIMVYLSSYIMFVNIAMKMKKQFYKLTAFGLSVVFIFQVFLCVGGVTKFIPSTGVTLPLISYGGSSIVTTIIIFSVIQGMYVLNGKEEESLEEETEKESSKRKSRG